MLEPDESADGVSHTWLLGEGMSDLNINSGVQGAAKLTHRNMTEHKCWEHTRGISNVEIVNKNDLVINVYKVWHKTHSENTFFKNHVKLIEYY